MTMSAPQLSLDDIRVRLHARGERMTRPRQAVLLALAEQPGHPTAEQLVSAVAARDSTVHRASVYRTLDALAQLGIVQHVHLGHGPTVYHLVSSGHDHVHLHCVGCGSITDAPVGLLESAAASLDVTDGFTLDLGHVALSGYCHDCRGSHSHGDD